MQYGLNKVKLRTKTLIEGKPPPDESNAAHYRHLLLG